MSGLVISLKADEKFLVNGALLINGSKRSQIRVGSDDVNVLRLSDALHPDEVKTPVRRVYYAAQIYLSGDAPESDIKSEVQTGLTSLAHVFEQTPLMPQIRKAEKAAAAGRFYTLLCALKPLMALEAELLQIAPPSICADDTAPRLIVPNAPAALHVTQARPKNHVVLPRNSRPFDRVETAPQGHPRETLTLIENTA